MAARLAAEPQSATPSPASAAGRFGFDKPNWAATAALRDDVPEVINAALTKDKWDGPDCDGQLLSLEPDGWHKWSCVNTNGARHIWVRECTPVLVDHRDIGYYVEVAGGDSLHPSPEGRDAAAEQAKTSVKAKKAELGLEQEDLAVKMAEFTAKAKKERMARAVGEEAEKPETANDELSMAADGAPDALAARRLVPRRNR